MVKDKNTVVAMVTIWDRKNIICFHGDCRRRLRMRRDLTGYCSGCKDLIGLCSHQMGGKTYVTKVLI
jgi:hypothetical protein